MEPESWRWANAQGQPIPISLSDLRSSLARGTIPAQAWVWQKGWRHWLPACRVQELRTALGRYARDPQTPVLDPKQTEPPARPPRPEPAPEPPRLSTPVPPPLRSQALGRRPPVPTVSDELPSAMPTLRPPGAVPPPPRNIPRAMVNELEDWDTSATEEPVASFHPATSSKPSQGRVPVVSPRSLEPAAVELPESELSAPVHAPSDSGSIPYDPDAVPGHGGAPLSPAKNGSASLAPLRYPRIARIALGVGLLSLATGTWLLLRPTGATRNPTVAPPTPPAAKTVVCRIARAAERVSPRVFMGVAPLALDAPYAQRAVVGFAESATTAAGITVDPNDLSVQFPYREPQTQKILSVTPVRLGEKLSFVTVRDGIPLSQARAVSNHNQFLFGVTPAGLARQLAGQAPETVWTLDEKTVVTDPRLVAVAGLGHAVTFRQGGQNGTIQLGYLTETGQSLTPPVTVRTKVAMLGTPTVAVSPKIELLRDVLVTFAGRNAESDPWTVYLSPASFGKPPQEAKAFPLPEGGPGFDAMSPSLLGLPEGHWLLQWSEGQTGQRQIRVQLLDAALRPQGKAHTVSPVASNSGQGLLWGDGTRAVSFFVISSGGKQAELWASSLTCSQ